MTDEKKISLIRNFSGRARAQASREEFVSALTNFNKARDLAKSLNVPPNEEISALSVEIGETLLKLGEVAEADAAFAEAMAYLPDEDLTTNRSGRSKKSTQAPGRQEDDESNPDIDDRDVDRDEQAPPVFTELDLSPLDMEGWGDGDGLTEEDLTLPISRKPEKIPASVPKEQVQLNPLVFVPGILGSSLGQKVFSNGRLTTARAFWPPDVAIMPDQSAAPSIAINGLRLQQSEVEPIGLFPGAYTSLIEGLRLMGYIENRNFWIFAYDWRQSNRETGKKLVAFIDAKLASNPLFSGKKMDVVCHSMGGFATRYAHKHGAQIERTIYVASPHYGSPKAHFMLHPGISMSESWVKAFLVQTAWERIFRRPGDIRELEEGVKRLARGFPAAWELMPDAYGIDRLTLEFIYYKGRSGRHNGWVKSAEETYFGGRWAFNSQYHNSIRNALDFKRNTLTYRIPGPPDKSLVIWSNSEETYDSITYRRVGSRGDTRPDVWEDMEDFGGKGDGTVPTASARQFLGATRVVQKPGEHSMLPNTTSVINEIGRFLDAI